METKPASLTLTPEEYRALVMARVDRSLREAGVALPDDLRRAIAVHIQPPADGASAIVASDGRRSTIQEMRARGEVPAPVESVDQRQKDHWPSPGVKPVDNPDTVQDLVLNALFKGCKTVPDLAKTTKKPRKAIYTALWALKKNGVIDRGEPSDH